VGGLSVCVVTVDLRNTDALLRAAATGKLCAAGLDTDSVSAQIPLLRFVVDFHSKSNRRSLSLKVI